MTFQNGILKLRAYGMCIQSTGIRIREKIKQWKGGAQAKWDPQVENSASFLSVLREQLSTLTGQPILITVLL